MIPIIYPYNMGSKSAKALAAALNTKRVKPAGRYRPKDNHLIINWGSGRRPTWLMGQFGLHRNRWLNDEMCITVASNKLHAFNRLQLEGVQVPEFTNDIQEAQDWLNAGNTVVARTLLRASGGRGICLCSSGDDLPRAPLYVKYVKKMHEYRIHVFNDKVIDIQQKKKRIEEEDVNYQIRNHDNGWVFARNDVDPPAAVIEQAVASVRALGLDFGAVDIIWNAKQESAYVLEVNTAPGLEGTTVNKYAEAIGEYCNGHM